MQFAGLPPLHKAAAEGDFLVVRNLVDAAGFDPNQSIRWKPEWQSYYWRAFTPLMAAAGSPKANAETVRILLDSGADAQIKNDYEVTALYFAVNGSLCRDIAEKKCSDQNRAECASLLIDAGLDPHAWSNGHDLVETAAMSASVECLKTLLAKGGKACGRCPVRDTDIGLLYYAAMSEDLETVDYVLSLGLDPSTKIFDNENALFAATTREICERLVKAGVPLQERNEDGQNALERAIDNGWIQSAEFLLTQNLSVSPEFATSMLNVFEMNGEGLKFLIDHDIIPVPEESYGAVLEFAVWQGQSSESARIFVEQLIRLGADPLIQDSNGSTLLVDAVFGDWGSPTSTEVLLQHGVDPNQADKDGFTPLMEAARWGELECIELLLKYGADPTLKSSGGWTAREYAQEYVKTWIRIVSDQRQTSLLDEAIDGNPDFGEFQEAIDNFKKYREETMTEDDRREEIDNEQQHRLETLQEARDSLAIIEAAIKNHNP